MYLLFSALCGGLIYLAAWAMCRVAALQKQVAQQGTALRNCEEWERQLSAKNMDLQVEREDLKYALENETNERQKVEELCERYRNLLDERESRAAAAEARQMAEMRNLLTYDGTDKGQEELDDGR